MFANNSNDNYVIIVCVCVISLAFAFVQNQKLEIKNACDQPNTRNNFIFHSFYLYSVSTLMYYLDCSKCLCMCLVHLKP